MQAVVAVAACGRRGLLGAGLCAALLLVSACGERETYLPGEREPVRVATDGAGNPLPPTSANEAAPIALPPAVANADWTHAGGEADHFLGNAALSAQPQLIWSTGIGTGASRRVKLVSHPVVAGGRVFALDANAQVSATSTAGAPLWQVALVPPGERAPEGFGGGLAVAGGRLFVTTGFGEVVALDPESGGILWRTGVEAAFRAAPASDGRIVVAVARNDASYGIDAATGETLWRSQGIGKGPGLIGGSGPALAGGLAIAPNIAGAVSGLGLRNGSEAWSSVLRGGRPGFVRGRIADVTGGPVVDGDTVYAANQSGQLARLDLHGGQRAWTLTQGAIGPVVPVGGSVFAITDEGELIRVEAASGRVIWRSELPEWVRPERRRRAVAHYGPVLAGGRLWVASSDGRLRGFDPVDGQVAVEVALPGAAASLPAVAGGRLYLVTDDGRLHAFQ